MIKHLSSIVVYALALLLLVTLFPTNVLKAEEEPLDSLTPAEREQGYAVFYPLGVIFQLPESYNGNTRVKRKHQGFSSTSFDLVNFSREYYYRSDKLAKLYQEIQGLDLPSSIKDERIKTEVGAKQVPLFAYFVLNVANIPADEKELKKQLGFAELVTLAEENGLRQVFAKGERQDSELEGEEKKAYNQLYDDIELVAKSERHFPPLKPEQSLPTVQDWQFEGQTLEGEIINQEILQRVPLTFVVYWTTWCPDCIQELNTLSWFDDYPGLADKVQILGVVADIYQENINEETLAKAKQILAERKLNFTAILNSDQLQKDLFKFCMNYPTTFFVDSKGRILKGGTDQAELEGLLEEVHFLLNQLASEAGTEPSPTPSSAPAPEQSTAEVAVPTPTQAAVSAPQILPTNATLYPSYQPTSNNVYEYKRPVVTGVLDPDDCGCN